MYRGTFASTLTAREEFQSHGPSCTCSLCASGVGASNSNRTHRCYSSSSSSSSERKPIDYASSMLAAQIKSHILGSADQISQNIKAWDITMTSPPRNPIWAVVEDYLVGHWQSMIAQFVQARIDHSFDLAGFLESARDAYWAVNTFSTTADFELLEPMMSKGLYNATKGIYEGFKKKGLRYDVTVGEDISARLCGVQFLSRREMAEYGESEGADGANEAEGAEGAEAGGAEAGGADEGVQRDNAMSGKHMVLTVEFGSSITVDIVKGKSGAGEGAGAEEGAEEASTVVDSSPRMVKFVTAEPLPDKLPQEELDVAWKVLKFA